MFSIVDTLKDFALPERRLFPCDTAFLTRASAAAFDKEASKLPCAEKIAAARHIAKRAHEHKVAVHNRLVARVAGDEISQMFKVALFSRKEVCAWHPQACRELDEMSRLGELINKQAQEHRRPLLDKLAAGIAEFDAKWRIEGVPDAVDTVFANDAVDSLVVRVGGRDIRADDLTRLDKVAAAKSLTPEAMASAENFVSFVMADDMTRSALVAFIPGHGG